MRWTAGLLVTLLGTAAVAQIGPPPGGGGGGSGTVTNIATSCGVSGGPITTTGTISGAAAIRANTGTTDTILSTDCGKVVTESNGAPVAITLPQATGSFDAPFFYTQVCLGAGTCTITPTTSTINGATTLVLITGQSADIVSDGTNYIAALGTSDIGLHPGYVVNNYYLPMGAAHSQTGGAPTSNTIYCYPVTMPERITISQMGARVANAGSTNLQLGIYANSSGLPGALIGNTGNIANTAAGTVVAGALAANKQVGPGGTDGGAYLWFCFNNGDSTATFNAMNTESGRTMQLAGATTLANAMGASAVNLLAKRCAGANCNGGSSTLGTWPATLAGSTWTDESTAIAPLILFRVGSVP